MKQKIRVLTSETYDPWFNLATEDYIFRDMDPAYKILFLWRNQNTVVIGRFQNPWKECNLKQMEADEILLARRQSGGGAVFHDLGNTNFTFLSSKQSFNKSAHNQMITSAINSFGLASFAHGRNDILVTTSDGDKKVSGSAFKENKDRAFHHGTLLIQTDLHKLANYLSPDKKKLETKGVASVRARVCNLSELNPAITHDELSRRIIENFFDFYQTECAIEKLDYEILKAEPKLHAYYQKMSDWNWRFGESPEFTYHFADRLSWGQVDVHLKVDKAILLETKIFSDTLYPEMIEWLMENLKNVTYEKSAIEPIFGRMKESHPVYAEQLEEFKSFLLHAIR